MDTADVLMMVTAIEAQFLMGHYPASVHHTGDLTTSIHAWSWHEDIVRQQLAVPRDAQWTERLLALEAQGLTSFSFYTTPGEYDEDGMFHEDPSWRDQPREDWGYTNIHAPGVLRLAERYGRPYVRCGESPALLAHWQLVHAEAQARGNAPYDPVRWAEEWPERAAVSRARTPRMLGDDQP
jgi:hypothetical protein